MKHTRINVAVGHEPYKAICQFFAFHGYLEVEIATWLGDEAAAQKCSAQIGSRATRLLDQMRKNSHFNAGFCENSQIVQRWLEIRLRRNGNEVVRGFMEHAASYRKLGFQLIKGVQRTNDETRNRADFRSNLELVSPRARKQQRAFNASDCGKRSFIAMTTRRNHAREFIFDIGGKRHE